MEAISVDAVQPTTRPSPTTVPKALEYINQHGKVISREKLYSALKKGDLPSFRLGRKILVDIDELLAAMRVK